MLKKSFSLTTPFLFKNLSLGILAIFLSSAPILAEDLAATPPADLRQDPALVKGQLDNGVTYALLPNSEPRERVSLRLLVRAGSLQESEDERGLAHYLEHMGFRGTENFAAGTLTEYFQDLGMAFGADTNAYTGFDRTVYMIELPENDLGKIDEGLVVLRDYAGRMLIEEEEVEAERGVILAEKRDRDSVRFRTAVEEFSFLLPESIIPRRFPIGSAEVIEAATAAQLRAFFEHWYRPERVGVVIVGEIDPEDVRPLVEKHFGDFAPARPAIETPDPGEVTGEDWQARLHYEPEAPQVRVALQTVRPYEAAPDTLDNRIQNLTRSVALRMLTRRLDELARQEEAPFLQGAAASYDLFNFFTNTSVELITTEENWQSTLQVAEQEKRRILEHGFTASELQVMKAEVERDYRQLARAANTRNSRTVAEQIIRSISNENVFTHPEDEYHWMRQALSAMTLDDVEEAFARAWDGEGIFVFVTGNLLFDRPEETIRQVYEESTAQVVEAPEESEMSEFQYTDFGEPGEIREEEYHEDLGVRQWVLANGIRVNVKPTDFSEAEIALRARLGNGRLDEPEELAGIGILAEMVFIEGGLVAHRPEELRRLLAGERVGWHLRAEDDGFVFNGQTNEDDLLRQLQLLAAYLTSPGYHDDALRRARERMDELYSEASRTSRGVLGNEVSRWLANGDFRFGLPEKDQLLSHDMADLRSYFEPILRDEVLEISIVGDFSTEVLQEALLPTLGALPARSETRPDLSDLRRISRPEGGQEKLFTYDSRIAAGRTNVYWAIPDMYEIQRTRRLSILANIFTNRMRREIREALGEAYSPFAASSPSDTFLDYGWFIAGIGSESENAATVATLTREIAADLHTEGADEDELRRALRPVQNSIRDSRRTNGYWMNSVLDRSQEQPERLHWARTIVEDFNSITLEEINALAREFLDPGEAIVVKVLSSEAADE
ncbi:MAG: insulinase family protein [Opitutales bacterium]|nr:insulinase family protein [Opitutales bacterium]